MNRHTHTPATHTLHYSAIAVSIAAILLTGCGTESGTDAVAKTELKQSNAPIESAHEEQLALDTSAVPAREYTQVKMRIAPESAAQSRAAFVSSPAYPAQFVSEFDEFAPSLQTQNRENYLSQTENAITRASEQPLSTFSIDVDTAAYANVRRMIAKEGRLPPSDAVKIEEFINYFDYRYPAPSSLDTPFSIHTEVAASPWNTGKYLIQIGLKGYQPPANKRPPANLVFLIDVSGSMASPDKLGLIKKSLRLLVNQMSAEDRIALTVYAGAAGTVLESTAGNNKAKILAALDNLSAGGSTHGSAGIELAYQTAEQHFIKGGINRVIIASDGDMNVGTTNLDALKNLIEDKRKTGIALTTLGFGSGNYNYALMEQLADVGNGNAAYIDSLREAQKVLVNEMQSTLLTIAKDVKIQVEFNPEQVAEYRLLGYQNRLLKREDFANDKVDAGDIGAGHSVTALYEIALTDSAGAQLPKLRYSREDAARIKKSNPHTSSDELAFIKLRYKKTDADTSEEIAQPVLRSDIQPNFARASENLRFAASVAGSAQLLARGNYIGSWRYADAIATARAAKGDDPHGYRGEFIALLELAQALGEHNLASNHLAED